jgi:hypothetical protein
MHVETSSFVAPILSAHRALGTRDEAIRVPAAFPCRTMRLIGRISARLRPDAGLTMYQAAALDVRGTGNFDTLDRDPGPPG